MNIKQAEELSGVSRQNIRFYEREGLLHPQRNPENDYREYTPEHIHTLKQIRAMRMLDMPLDQIKLMLDGKLSPASAAAQQQRRLAEQQNQLAAAIRFCEEWSVVSDLKAVDVDDLLSRMEQPENAGGLFRKWQEDYRKVVLSERQKAFTFIPEGAVSNSREFTAALITFANDHDLDLVVTRESMYPEFTIDGIEYTAERHYTSVQRVPVAVIRCSVKYPEDFEPNVPDKRKKIMKLLYNSWLPVLACLLLLRGLASQEGIFSSWEGWALLIILGIMIIVTYVRARILHFNEIQ